MNIRNVISLSAVAIVLGVSVVGAQPPYEDARFKLAQGYEQSGDMKSAARIYTELFEEDNRSLAYFDGVRRTYVALLRFAELLPMVETRLRIDPKDLDLRTLYADLLHRNHRSEEAEEQWDEAIALQPNDAFTYAIVAQSQIDNRLFDAAVQTYLTGRKRLGMPTVYGEQLAQIYGILGRFEEATTEYVAILSENPTRLGFVMGAMGLLTGNPAATAAAIPVVERAMERRPDYAPFTELLSWLYTEKGDYEGSFAIAVKMDGAKGARGSNVFAFADRAMREGRYDFAIKAFDHFLKTYTPENPLYTTVLLTYAKALDRKYHASGGRSEQDVAELIERYETIADENRGTPFAAEALLLKAQLEAEDLDRPADALETLEILLRDYERSPLHREALLLQADLFLRTGDLDRAEALYRRGTESTQSGTDAAAYRDLSMLRLAETWFYQGKFKEASDMFRRLSANTASDAANDALQYLFLIDENIEKEETALASFAAGRLALAQKKWEEAIGKMEKAVEQGPLSSLADDALFGVAQAQEMLDRPADAIATLLSISEKYRDGTTADRALFHAAELAQEKLRDIPKAVELYTRLLTEHPTSTFTSVARQRIRELREKAGGS